MTRTLSPAFGLLMVAAGAVHADGAALVAAAVAVGAVVVGVAVRSAATLAVVATVAALALSEPSPVVAVLAGLAAAAYLVTRHARGGDSGIGAPAAIGAIGLSLVAVLGVTVPVGVPWVPLVAPLAVVIVYVLTVGPLAG